MGVPHAASLQRFTFASTPHTSRSRLIQVPSRSQSQFFRMTRTMHHFKEADLVSGIRSSLLVVQSSLSTYSQAMKLQFQVCDMIMAQDVSTYLDTISAALSRAGLVGVEPIVKSKDARFLVNCKDFLEELEDLEADHIEEQDGDATVVDEAFSLVIELACSVDSKRPRETEATCKKERASSRDGRRTERPGESEPDA